MKKAGEGQAWSIRGVAQGTEQAAEGVDAGGRSLRAVPAGQECSWQLGRVPAQVHAASPRTGAGETLGTGSHSCGAARVPESWFLRL